MNTSHLLAYIRAYVSPIVQYGVLLYGLGRKTMLQQILVVQKKLVRIAFRLPYRSSVLGKFKDCKICTVFELHIYELLKYSISQIRNNFFLFLIPSYRVPAERYKKQGKNIWNYAANNDVLDFRAISLINILREWGVFPSDHEVNEMKDEQLRNFQPRIADLYIFGNGELVDLIFRILALSSLQKLPSLYLTLQKNLNSKPNFSSKVSPWKAWVLLGGLFGSWVRFVKCFKI